MQKVLLEGLNDEQLDAVTSTEGPLLIIAGAGTGKTRVITRRIAYLLESKPDLAPENILALTYTNKAADEMRERVEALTGLDTADMFIGTIHAFCNQVLDEAGTHIGLPKLRQIDEIDQWIFLEDSLEKLGLNYYLTLANPRDVLKDFVRFVSRCKDEMVLPQDYAEYASGLRAEFELGRGELGDEERRARELEVIREEELARVYRIYQDELLKAGLRDFGDSIIYTIKLFKERPNILQSYQEQFKYILIDEFQDTNLAQIEIFALLAARHRNICACGDSDQAIYRFRGASFASFNHFIDKFPEAKKVRLNKNYRSGRHILSAACRLIENNGADRFEPAVLIPNNGEGEQVSILICPDHADEARAVAHEIKRIYLSLPEGERRFSDFAVLYRAHAHKDEIIKELKAGDIPFIVSGVGLFERPEIRNILAFLSVVADSRDSVACTRILSSGLLDIPARDILHILHHARIKDIPVLQAVEKFDDINGLSSETCEKLSFLASVLSRLEDAAVDRDIWDFIFELLNITGYMAMLLTDPTSEQAVKNIGAFCRFASEYADRAGDKGLHGFMRYLERYREAGGNPDQAGLEADVDAIRLMTIHGAKGLEFPYVFVVGLTSRRFPTSRRKDAIPFPDVLNRDILPGEDFHIQEERRLCYVAMTRAIEKLYLCTVEKKGAKRSQFIQEISGNGEGDYVIEQVSAMSDPTGDVHRHFKKLDRLRAELTRDVVRILHGLPGIVDDEEALGGSMARAVERMWSLVRLAHITGKNPVYYEEALSELDSLWPRITQEILSDQPIFISELARKRAVLSLNEGIQQSSVKVGRGTATTQKSLKLSFTQIDLYQRCPRQYYYKYVMRVPTRPVAALSFGDVMHRVLAKFYKSIGAGKVPTVDDLIDLYEACWSSRGYESAFHEEEYKRRGYELLRNFYALNAPKAKPALSLEAPFKLQIGDHLVMGRIDRIDELTDGTVEIIDYKTGKPKDQKSADSSLQLGLYALASIKEFNRIPSALSFYYLEANEKVTSARTKEELEKVEATVLECASGIKSRKFDPKLNIAGHCKWCDFNLLCDVFGM